MRLRIANTITFKNTVLKNWKFFSPKVDFSNQEKKQKQLLHIFCLPISHHHLGKS